MRPPTTLFEPVLATRVFCADEEEIVLAATPAKPPTKLLPPAVTAPEAVVFETDPPPRLPLLPPVNPTSPPAMLDAPTVTLPEAFELMIVAVLSWPSPTKQPSQLELLLGELLPARPPATLLSPADTALLANDPEMMPWLLPTSPPTPRAAVVGEPTVPAANEFVICPVFVPTRPPSVVWLPLLMVPVPAAPTTLAIANALV